jgi:hypothetical protein
VSAVLLRCFVTSFGCLVGQLLVHAGSVEIGVHQEPDKTETPPIGSGGTVAETVYESRHSEPFSSTTVHLQRRLAAPFPGAPDGGLTIRAFYAMNAVLAGPEFASSAAPVIAVDFAEASRGERHREVNCGLASLRCYSQRSPIS